MSEKERPPYWLPVEHSMIRRSQHNNYHIGHKAYMVTLKIQDMVPLLGQVMPTTTGCATAAATATATAVATAAAPAAAPTVATAAATATSGAPLFDATRRIAECRLTPLGEAMRRAWLTLPQRFPNITVIDSPAEYVVMPEHFHGIIYVMAHMEEHLSDIIRLFKARVAMTYRKLLLDTTLYTPQTQPSASMPQPSASMPQPSASMPQPSASTQPQPSRATQTWGALRPIGLAQEWMRAYAALPPEQQAATRRWVEGQHELLYAATRRSKEEERALQQALGPSPIRVAASGSHGKTGFLFAIGYTDSILLDDDNLVGHRLYIFNNPRSRWQRSNNRALLKANRAPIFTAVSIPALMGYLKRECAPRDVTQEKLDAVRSHLLYSATRRRTESQPNNNQPAASSNNNQPAASPNNNQPAASLPATVTRTEIYCHSYGDRELLQRRLLPVVCHRKDAALFPQQKARCLQAAASGAVMVSAAISLREREIMQAVMADGFPVIHIEDNGFPELFHPSQSREDLCHSQCLLIVTPWQHHYRHKDDSIFVAYCKTMNCIAQALCSTSDGWWKH